MGQNKELACAVAVGVRKKSSADLGAKTETVGELTSDEKDAAMNARRQLDRYLLSGK